MLQPWLFDGLHDLVLEAGQLQWVYGENAVFHQQNGILSAVAETSNATTTSIGNVAAVNDQIAWALDNQSRILRTINGGINWDTQKVSAQAILTQLAAANASVAWVTSKGGGLLKTSDGGASWAPQASDQGVLNSVSAVNELVVWAAGSNGKIIKSVDGGAHWLTQNSGTTLGIRTIKALSIKEAWAISSGGIDPPFEPGQVLRTTNGSDWVRVDTPVTATFGWLGMSAPTPQTIWLSAEVKLGDSFILISTEAGVTWRTLSPPSKLRVFALTALDAQHAWASDASGIWTTADGGQTWHLQPFANQLVANITALDNQTLWAIDAKGFIYKTVTGGE